MAVSPLETLYNCTVTLHTMINRGCFAVDCYYVSQTEDKTHSLKGETMYSVSLHLHLRTSQKHIRAGS